MFAWWGRTVYRYRYIVIGVMVALCLGGGIFGLSLGKHVTQSGFYDDGSQSVKASILGDKTYGRDRTGHDRGDLHRSRRQDRRRPGLATDRSSTNSTSSSRTIPTRSSAGPAIWHWHPAPRPRTPRSRGWRPRTRSTPSSPSRSRATTTTPSSTTTRPSRPTCRSSTAARSTRRPGADRQRLDRHHRHRPATHGGPGAAAGGGGAVPGVRRRDRRRPAGHRGRTEHCGRAGHPAARRHLRAGALLRPAGGLAGRSGYRHRLRAFHREPVPGRDRRRLRHRGRGATHRDDGRAHDRCSRRC